MSVKLLKLHWRIFYWTFTGRINKLGPRLKLTLTKGRAERILIAFPMDEPSFKVALYAFRNLVPKKMHRRNYKYIVREQFKTLFHLRSGTPILVRNSLFLIFYEIRYETRRHKIRYESCYEILKFNSPKDRPTF